MTQLLRHWQDIPPLTSSVVTIGNFDGVHCGHQTILQRVLTISQTQHLASIVMFFEPQPQEFFAPDKAPPRLPQWIGVINLKLYVIWALIMC
jgi:riboflavin kinase/FMN adenylyltransferase